jgi:hypothetical protein
MSASFLNTSWPNAKTGITGGTVTLQGQYIDPSDVAGTEANLFGYYFNVPIGVLLVKTHNTATNRFRHELLQIRLFIWDIINSWLLVQGLSCRGLSITYYYCGINE